MIASRYLRTRIVRVTGKGDKEWLVPFNTGAQTALRAWYADRALLRTARQPDADAATTKGRSWDPRSHGRGPTPIRCSSTRAARG
jgi:site-specific recombinase XerC